MGWSFAEVQQAMPGRKGGNRDEATRLNQRPSFMRLGKPFSQPFCAFQGREEVFSASVVVQPVPAKASTASTSSSQTNREMSG